MNQFWIFVASHTGFAFEIVVLSLALTLVAGGRPFRFRLRNFQRVAFTVAAFFLFRLMGEILKNGLAIPRVCWDPGQIPLIPCPTSFAFPSGHAIGSLMAAVILGLVTRKSAVWIVGITTAAVISLSRIVSLVHRPTEVLAGGVLGLVFGFLVYHFFWKRA